MVLLSASFQYMHYTKIRLHGNLNLGTEETTKPTKRRRPSADQRREAEEVYYLPPVLFFPAYYDSLDRKSIYFHSFDTDIDCTTRRNISVICSSNCTNFDFSTAYAPVPW